MIPNETIKKIQEEVNIVEVVSEYVNLKKSGNNYVGLCPFHDDKNNPSMTVSAEKKIFNCWTCHTKGNVIQFVSKIENISFSQAAIKLGKRVGIAVSDNLNKEDEKRNRLYDLLDEASNFYQFYLNHSEEGIKALEYLHNRGIDDEIIKIFKIGLAPDLFDSLTKHLTKKNYLELDQIEVGIARDGNKGLYDTFRNRIMFPLSNVYGRTIGFSGRIYNQVDQAKYINSNDNYVFHKSDVLYNLNNAVSEINKKKQVYIYEGFMDVIAAYRCGMKNAVATMGTALTKSHINTLLKLTQNIVLCFDGDSAGIGAMHHAATLFSEFNVIPYSVVLPNNQDPDEYIKEHGSKALYDYLNNEARPVYEWLYRLAKKRLVVGDLISSESFKKEVFAFLKETKVSTVVEYYLNQMAKDLNVEFESIKRDFDKYNFSYSNYQPKDIKKEVKETKTTTSKKVKRAFQVIIKHLLYDSQIYNKIDGNEFIDTSLNL